VLLPFRALDLRPSEVPRCASHAAINFSVPTRIQQAVLPVMLGGRDVLASAPTGSGKTLSYIAPVVHHIQVI